MNSNDSPIGIFDSGVGGLTVAKTISQVLPNESIIYFGDTAHLPYGDKSKESIQNYSIRITQLLIDKGCKAIVIACNTASAHAFSTLNEKFPNIPIINVVDPTVELCTKKYPNGKIGVIATKGTVKSRVYPRKIQKINPKIEVPQNATPLLVPMIEEGYFNNNISKTIIHSYLSSKNFKDIDALILGCTHFPLIKKEVESYFKKNVEVIDSASVVAKYLKDVLKKNNLLSDKKVEKNLFLVSDFTSSFEKTSKLFFGEKIQLKEMRIWG